MTSADLRVGRTYLGGTNGNVSDDPIQRLLPVGNQGGIRYKGSVKRNEVRLVVLYTNGRDPDWPDTVDGATATVTYFGDNKRPGRELHDTRRRGNLLLKQLFDRARGPQIDRALIPPVFIFARGARGRDVVFMGLAIPGSPSIPPGDDLVAEWRSVRGARFQNYRATFTLLDVPVASRAWIDQSVAGLPLGSHCPAPWRRWVDAGAIQAARL